MIDPVKPARNKSPTADAEKLYGGMLKIAVSVTKISESHARSAE
jgi:hypothetical protein